MASELTSASSLDDVIASYTNNASYAEDDSITKAKRFITACRIMLIKRPSSMTKGSNQLNFNLQVIEEELRRAQIWLEARDPDSNAGPTVTRPNFNNFRGY